MSAAGLGGGGGGDIVVGARVSLQGLKSRPDLNGSRGTVTGFLADKGRYQVLCQADGQTRALKPANLVTSKAVEAESEAEREAAAEAAAGIAFMTYEAPEAPGAALSRSEWHSLPWQVTDEDVLRSKGKVLPKGIVRLHPSRSYVRAVGIAGVAGVFGVSTAGGAGAGDSDDDGESGGGGGGEGGSREAGARADSRIGEATGGVGSSAAAGGRVAQAKQAVLEKMGGLAGASAPTQRSGFKGRPWTFVVRGFVRNDKAVAQARVDEQRAAGESREAAEAADAAAAAGESSFEIGSRVTIVGLKSRADLNGTAGTVEAVNDNGRYQVLCQLDGVSRALKPACLRPSETAPAEERAAAAAAAKDKAAAEQEVDLYLSCESKEEMLRWMTAVQIKLLVPQQQQRRRR